MILGGVRSRLQHYAQKIGVKKKLLPYADCCAENTTAGRPVVQKIKLLLCQTSARRKNVYTTASVCPMDVRVNQHVCVADARTAARTGG